MSSGAPAEASVELYNLHRLMRGQWTGAPAEALVELYNKLIHLPFSKKTEIGQIEFRLRALHTKAPSDTRANVALLQALMMSGKVQEATETANSIWGMRNWLENDTMLTFVGQLADLGMYDRARELASALLVERGDTPRPSLVGGAIQVAVGTGDVELLKKVPEWGISSDFRDQIEGFVSELQRAGLESHFARHQSIVHEIVSGDLCSHLGIFQKNDGRFELSVYIYVNEERSVRRGLEERIDAALAEYYTDQGLDPTAYVPLITTSVLDLTARHPFAVA